MSHHKPRIQNHLLSAEKGLAVRVELLKTKGIDGSRVEKDCQIRKLKAQVRKAKRQLTAIAALETQMAEKAEVRIRKEAAAKSEAHQKKSKKRDVNAPPAKKRKKRRIESDEIEQAA
jgi:hypothetical protein